MQNQQAAGVVRWLHAVGHDSRFALRQMRGAPGITAVAVLAIAVAIAANAAVASFFDAVHMRRLVSPAAGRLIALHQVDDRQPEAHRTLSADDYDHYRRAATTLEGLAVQEAGWAWLTNGDQSLEWRLARVSPNYFGLLGLDPHLGAFFSDDREHGAVVLSHAAWQRTFQSDPAIVGRLLRLNRQALTVIGVAPPKFEGIYVGDAVDVWMVHPRPAGIGIGRLRTPLAEAAAELATLSQLRARDAGQAPRSRAVVEPLRGVHPDIRHGLERLSALLAVSSACLLAVACANIAGLLLARADSRRREIALRSSLGASRGRIVRQLLTESTVVAGLGGAAGLALLAAARGSLQNALSYQLPGVELQIDWRIAALTFALSALTGVLFGSLPAYQAARRDLSAAMRARSYPGLAAIGVQVALATTLLICAGLLFQSMRTVLAPPGIDADRFAHFRLRPSRVNYTLEQARQYQKELLRRVQEVPGVERAVVARVPPQRGWCCEIDVAVAGAAPVRIEQNEVSPGFLPTLGIPLLAGRDFLDDDRGVVIVNRALAARFWPDQDALDRELVIDGAPHRVIGVAENVHALQSGERAHPYLYLPIWGRDAPDPRLFVRVHGRAAPMLEQIRRAVVSVDPDVHIGQEGSLGDRAAATYQRERLLTAALQMTALVAVALSAIGIYALVSYQIRRRAREIGIRKALGAQTGQIMGWVLRRGALAVSAGLIGGAAGAVLVGRTLTSYLYGVDPDDTATFAFGLAAVALVAVVASLMPARAVAAIDPAVALRSE